MTGDVYCLKLPLYLGLGSEFLVAFTIGVDTVIIESALYEARKHVIVLLSMGRRYLAGLIVEAIIGLHERRFTA